MNMDDQRANMIFNTVAKAIVIIWILLIVVWNLI